MTQHIGVGADEHAHLAVEGAHASERAIGPVLRPFHQIKAAFAVYDPGHRRELRQGFRQHHRPRARPAAAMGRGEGLVQIDVHGVDAEIAWAHPADDGVKVGPVTVEIGARLVGQARDFHDVALEQAAGVGVGNHDGGDVRAELGGEVGEIDPAVLGLGDLLHLVADKGGGGGVGAVRRRGSEHGVAGVLGLEPVAGRPVRRPDGEQAAELAVGARLGRQRHRRHPGQGLQPVRQPVHQLQRTLHGRDRLQRVQIGEPRHPRRLLVQARVVLHGARTQGIERQVDSVVLLAQPHVVAHGFGLREPRQADGIGAYQVA